MVAQTLLAAIEAAKRRGAEDAARRGAEGVAFVAAFAAFQRARAAKSAATAPKPATDAGVTWEDDADEEPQRLPDVPTVRDEKPARAKTRRRRR